MYWQTDDTSDVCNQRQFQLIAIGREIGCNQAIMSIGETIS